MKNNRRGEMSEPIKQLFGAIHEYIGKLGGMPARWSVKGGFSCYDDRRPIKHNPRRKTVYHIRTGNTILRLYLIKGVYKDPLGKLVDSRSYSELYVREEEINDAFIEYVLDLVKQGYEM